MVHPHTHPTRPDQGRVETDRDVLDIALQLRNMLSNEEIWYVLQTWKDKVRADAKKEAYEKDDPLDYNESSLQPWDNIGGEAVSKREQAELPNCILDAP